MSVVCRSVHISDSKSEKDSMPNDSFGLPVEPGRAYSVCHSRSSDRVVTATLEVMAVVVAATGVFIARILSSFRSVSMKSESTRGS